VSANPSILPNRELSPEDHGRGSAWNRIDRMLLGGFALAAVATRFWNLGYPDEPVFDEIQFVGQAVAYLRGEQFLDVHPGLVMVIIAFFTKLLGQHAWVWRIPSAALGSWLVIVTFLLCREMFRSRVAAVLGALFVLCDGMFLVHSRLAMLEIYHLTFTATSYLLLYQFLRTHDPARERRKILYLALVSGAALASKLMVPEIGFLLVAGFLARELIARAPNHSLRDRRVLSSLLLLLSGSSIVYFATFMPNYWLGWWGGAWSMLHYYHEVLWALGSFANSTSIFISPWWSWPLMLRAPLYWQRAIGDGQVATIWAGGNPVLWWSSLGALAITLVDGVSRPTTARSFLLIGWVSYLFALALPKHPFFIYIYMAPLYLQYLMLAAVLASFWEGASQPWEHLVIILSLAPDCVLGLGSAPGVSCLLGIAAIYAILAWRFTIAGKFVCVVFIGAALLAFVYFLPLWLGLPLDQAGYEARLWLHGPGLAKWL
jgi:dolichyl-phosphate-mannose-protein mannosyltransferase